MTGTAGSPGPAGSGAGRRRRRLDVGLTGGIGSGKSEVSRRLAERGAVVVDADLLARQVVEPGSAGLAAVVAEFGRDVLAPDGSLDRPRLATLVFADPRRRERLNAIVHPLVGERARRLADAAPDGSVVVHDVPLLVEAGLADRYDVVLVVDASEPVRLDRLVRLRGMTEADARARMSAQAPPADRLAAADLVIRNDGDLDELDRQVAAVWPQLRARAAAGNAGVTPPRGPEG